MAFQIMIKNVELERYCVSALLRHPKLLADIGFFVNSEDFAASKLHKTTYQAIGDLLKKGEEVNVYAVHEKIKNLGIRFSETEDIFSYLEAVRNLEISETGANQFFKDLKKTTILREIDLAADNIKKECINLNREKADIEKILSSVDGIFGATMGSFQTQANQTFVNLYENLEALVHQKIAQGETKSVGFSTPFKRLNEIFGPLFRAGHISLVAARTNVGKTSLGLFLMNWVAMNYGVPIVHIDNGESSEWELRERAIVQFTNGAIPLHMLENGTWRNNPETERLVTAALKRMEKFKCYYYDVCGKNTDEVVSLIRRFSMMHCNRVGGENQFLTHYDYIKRLKMDKFTKEHEEMGVFVQAMKNLYQKEIRAPLHTSLQINREGVVGNKTADTVNETDDTFSLSDRINQQVSWSGILREMTLDEMATYPNLGNLMLINTKKRFGGVDIQAAQLPVKMSDGSLRKNRIFIEGSNFCYIEKGDLKTIAPKLGTFNNPSDDKDGDDANI